MSQWTPHIIALLCVFLSFCDVNVITCVGSDVILNGPKKYYKEERSHARWMNILLGGMCFGGQAGRKLTSDMYRFHVQKEQECNRNLAIMNVPSENSEINELVNDE